LTATSRRDRSLKKAIARYFGYRFAIRHWRRLLELPAAGEILKTMRDARVVKPIVSDPPRGNVLVIAPHPDDEAIGPGGTLLRLASAGGARLSLLVMTAGPTADQATRRFESEATAQRLGGSFHCLDFTDGNISVDEASVARFAAAIDALAPDALMLPFALDDHDDHRRANELLVKAATRLACQPEVWAYQVYGGVLCNVVVDITEVAEAKRQLIRGYASQMAARDWANFSLGLAAWNSRFLPRQDTAFAEMFLVLPLRDYVALVRNLFQDGVAYRSKTYQAK
jgi:N-acetylglucosamine malate deacetylase 1